VRALALLAALVSAQVSAQALAQPLVVGAVVAQSGQLADLAADMHKALVLWQETRNAAGGLLGRRIELKLLDDRSEGSASTRLYEQLIDVERAELLIGPFGSAASVSAAGIAERRKRVLVNATGLTRSVHRAGTRYVFQVPASLAAYGEGALEIVRAMGYRRLLVVARSDPASREAAAQFVERATAAGLEPGPVEQVAAGANDYKEQIARAHARDAQAWIAFGQPEDAADMVKAFKRVGYSPWLFLAQGSAEPRFLKMVGRDGEFVLGISPYETGFATRGNREFLDAWRKRWPAEPGVVAATAYAAAMILEEGVRKAGSVETEALRGALAALHTETPIGRFRVDGGGIQVAARPVVVQIVAGRREIVWPEALATAKWRLPYPRWDQR
jgi:branched-chain amino acid transport system substrate-binding protein